ncbi:aldehyde ferredoxin oxidoreductase family protein [Moorella sulfitireducens (nom. illeg.)]|uniref:aldehyde ferredoxin oxidoreductase family protein n=1 Tax=Neomoorella sulfitireducens TaxID=2972948 RepID=UPI0021AC8301|nr:aldehyde ferredoxin oxidoreductase family protein [Moorella sulfitireducens]
MKGGYVGKLLFVDLTTSSIREEELSFDLAKNFIGGYGIGAKFLFDMMKPGVDPLGPENVIGFVTGPLTGSGAYMGGRYMVVCKSPVYGGWNDANAGGYFGPELKKAGYDGVFVTGAAAKPVYLWINDGNVEIRDASKLWGKDAKEVLDALIEQTGEPKLRAAVIGPAGEHLSLMAAVINDGHRAAARGGSGAVMGSKKLKAVVVRGTGEIRVADRQRLSELNKAIREAIANPPDNVFGQYVRGFANLGTGSTTTPSVLSGDAPVKNWGGIGIEDFGVERAKKVGNQSFNENYFVKKYACAFCPLACGAIYRVDGGKWPLGITERPEYETAAAFGPNCLNDDVEAILKCNELCNRFGLDTISVGATIAWVMECYEKGLLGPEELDGIEAVWGNAEAIVALTEKIANNEGCGKILALGSQAAAQKWGKGYEYLQTAMGIEVAMHDPRLNPGWARVYQYDPTPGRHVKGGAASVPLNIPDRGKVDVAMASNFEILSSAGLCQFSMFAFPKGAIKELLEAVTGEGFSEEELFTAGVRIFTMRHSFNVREGLKRADYTISPRVTGKPPLPQGPTAGVTVDNEKLGNEFYATLGWDINTGIPGKDTLERLGGMANVIATLYGG